MYYFNNEYLKQYLKSGGGTVKVYVNGDFYKIIDDEDLAHNEYGVGYEETGKAITFPYKSITAVKIGDAEFTIDQLQAAFDSDSSADKSSDPPAEPAADEPKAPVDPDAEPDKKEKDPQKSNKYYEKAIVDYQIRHGHV